MRAHIGRAVEVVQGLGMCSMCWWLPPRFLLILPPPFSQITGYLGERGKGTVGVMEVITKPERLQLPRGCWRSQYHQRHLQITSLQLALLPAELTNKDPLLSFISRTSPSKLWWEMERHWLVWLWGRSPSRLRTAHWGPGMMMVHPTLESEAHPRKLSTKEP